MTLAYRPNAAALLAFVCAALLTALIVPLIRQVALRWGIVDQPDERKQHLEPMVRLGGIGIVSGFSIGLGFIWALGAFSLLPIGRDQVIWTTLAGALCLFVIGLADDLFALPPLPRLAGQVAVAMAVWSQGVAISSIEWPFSLA